MKRLADIYSEDYIATKLPRKSLEIFSILPITNDKSAGYSEDDILYNNKPDDEVVAVADRKNYSRPTTGRNNS